MRPQAILLVLLLLTAGCAEVSKSFAKYPQRTEDAFNDPIRRSHIVTQTVRLASVASTGITCAILLAPTIVGMVVCPVLAVIADFISYEFLLEPASKQRVKEGKPSLIGPYWETGPAENETFTQP